MTRISENARVLSRALLRSTALIGIILRPARAPAVPYLATSPALLRERQASLLALAIETSASLLARLCPLRVRKVRPAARIGRRRRWREAVLAAAASVLLTAASTAHAQDATWNGATSDYGTSANWTQNTVPDSGGNVTLPPDCPRS